MRRLGTFFVLCIILLTACTSAPLEPTKVVGAVAEPPTKAVSFTLSPLILDTQANTPKPTKTSPTPELTATPTKTPTPEATETEAATAIPPELTVTKEVMAIQTEGLTPESRVDIAEGKLELDPKVAQDVYKKLLTAFLNDGWANQDYFNKYFPGALGNYNEFMRQLRTKDYQMPAGFKIPRPIGNDCYDAIPFELGVFKFDTVILDLWTVDQTTVRRALPDGDPNKLRDDEILGETTPLSDIHALKLITGGDGITRLQWISAFASVITEAPQWTMFDHINGEELTPAAISTLGNMVGFMPVVVEGMKLAEASFLHGSEKYMPVVCLSKPNQPNCRKAIQESYNLFEKDPSKMVFQGLFKLAGSGG
jgi:hypothetical protein